MREVSFVLLKFSVFLLEYVSCASHRTKCMAQVSRIPRTVGERENGEREREGGPTRSDKKVLSDIFVSPCALSPRCIFGCDQSDSSVGHLISLCAEHSAISR